MDILNGILLGIVQGLTEFLPVSSTGHLVLAHEFLSFNGTDNLAFDAILHLATALAVIVYFHKDIHSLIQTTLRKLARMPVDIKELRMVYALIVGTVPAVLFGLTLESYLSDAVRTPLLIGIALIVGSILFIVAEIKHEKNPTRQNITFKTALVIGLFQALALIPGISRSGATISGGMLLGLSRSESARFAFLLAIPVILGAGMKKLFELITSSQPIEWSPIFFGALAAFVVGMGAVHFLITFMKRHTLWPFIWYRIALAGFCIWVGLVM